jgi:hypothetical protein
LLGETIILWNQLKDMCGQVILTYEKDSSRWILEKSGKFKVKSLYLALKLKNVKDSLLEYVAG